MGDQPSNPDASPAEPQPTVPAEPPGMAVVRVMIGFCLVVVALAVLVGYAFLRADLNAGMPADLPAKVVCIVAVDSICVIGALLLLVGGSYVVFCSRPDRVTKVRKFAVRVLLVVIALAFVVAIAAIVAYALWPEYFLA